MLDHLVTDHNSAQDCVRFGGDGFRSKDDETVKETYSPYSSELWTKALSASLTSSEEWRVDERVRGFAELFGVKMKTKTENNKWNNKKKKKKKKKWNKKKKRKKNKKKVKDVSMKES